MTPSPSTTDCADLLGEHRALLSLARTLVRDADLAEDLVQETWLADLGRRPTAVANRLRYLRGVLRNLVRRRLRGDKRRRARESAVAAAGHEPPCDEWLERVRMQRCIADAVLALEEPYRETLLLRFWEELPPRQIAARQGVPVATVRTRLQRAVQRLRGQLDRDVPGGRRGWMAVLLVMARRPLPTPVKASGRSGGPVAQPVVLMTSVLCSIAIFTSTVVSTASDPVPRPGFPDSLPAGVVASASAALPAPRLVVPPHADPTIEQARRVRLRVLDAHGDPVSGALVRSYRSAWVTPPGGVQDPSDLLELLRAGRLQRRPDVLVRTPVDEVASDASGVAVIECAEPDMRLHVVGPDESRSGWIALPVAGVEEQVVRLVAGCRVHGVVRDAAGRPAGGLTLRFSPVGEQLGFSARTPDPSPIGPDGRFELWVDPRASFVLEVEGGAPAECRRIQTVPGADLPLEMRLLGAAHVTVRVVDAAGAELTGAKVRARFEQPEPGAGPHTRQSFLPVEAQGLEPLIALPSAGTYEISGWHAEHELGVATVAVGYGEIGDVTLVATAPRVDVGGVVLGAGGQPLAAADVRCVESRRSFDAPGPCRATRADASGRFRFDGLVAGRRYDFLWIPSADRPDWVARHLGVVAGSGGEITLEPTPPVSVELDVVDDHTGLRVQSFRYSLGVASDMGWRIGAAREAAADGGPTRVDGLASGAAFRLRVEAPGYGLCVVESVEGRTPVVTARLQRAAGLDLRVLDAQGREVPRASIRIVQSAAPWQGTGLDGFRAGHTDAEGRFAAEGLGAGDHRIVVDAGARGRLSVDLSLPAGETVERVLSLTR